MTKMATITHKKHKKIEGYFSFLLCILPARGGSAWGGCFFVAAFGFRVLFTTI